MLSMSVVKFIKVIGLTVLIVGATFISSTGTNVQSFLFGSHSHRSTNTISALNGGGNSGASSSSVYSCGDGIINQASEECDDGNWLNTDSCTIECLLAACPDGFLRTDISSYSAGYEECDDGNFSSDDGCLNDCTHAYCGDGIQRTDQSSSDSSYEECDDANSSENDSCLSNCRAASCGDGHLRTDLGIDSAGYEYCDDGNTTNTDGCINSCSSASCGDGHVYAGVESCDDGNNIDIDTCPNNCNFPSSSSSSSYSSYSSSSYSSSSSSYCGDGTVDPGEECDNGVGNSGDSTGPDLTAHGSCTATGCERRCKAEGNFNNATKIYDGFAACVGGGGVIDWSLCDCDCPDGAIFDAPSSACVALACPDNMPADIDRNGTTAVCRDQCTGMFDGEPAIEFCVAECVCGCPGSPGDRKSVV